MKKLLYIPIALLFLSCGGEGEVENASNETGEEVIEGEIEFDDCGYDNHIEAAYYEYYSDKDSLITVEFNAEYTFAKYSPSGTLVIIGSDKDLGDNPYSTAYKNLEQHVIMLKIDEEEQTDQGVDLDVTENLRSELQIQGFGTFYQYCCSNDKDDFDGISENVIHLERFTANEVCVSFSIVLDTDYTVEGTISAPILEDDRRN